MANANNRDLRLTSKFIYVRDFIIIHFVVNVYHGKSDRKAIKRIHVQL